MVRAEQRQDIVIRDGRLHLARIPVDQNYFAGANLFDAGVPVELNPAFVDTVIEFLLVAESDVIGKAAAYDQSDLVNLFGRSKCNLLVTTPSNQIQRGFHS